MAKPDTENGWYKMSHELDAAIAVADFTKAEAVVLREIRAQTCFPRSRPSAELSPTEIGRKVGMNRVNISQAIASLITGGTLVKTEDGYRFEADYERWTKKGIARLSSAEVAYCRSSNPNPKRESEPDARSQRTTESVVNGLQPCSQRTTPAVVNELQARSQRTTQRVVNGLQSRARAIEERAELDLIQIELDHSRESSEGVHTTIQASLRAETQPESKSVPTLPTTPAQLTVVELLLERLGENPKDHYSDNRALCQVAVDGWTTAGHSDAEQRSAVHLAGANGVQGPRIIPYATKVLASAAAKRAATASIKPYVAGVTPAQATPGLWVDPRTEAEKEADRKMRELRASKLPPNPLLRRTP